MSRICDTRQPQALAALYDIPMQRLVEFNRAIYLDRISDPGNLGTIFRTAAAFCIEQIILSPQCCEPTSPKVIRASLGSVFWVPYIVEGYDWLLSQNALTIAADAKAQASLGSLTVPLKDPSGHNKIILVIGSEAHGVDESILRNCTQRIRIDMHESMESLNASVAAGIMMWKIFGVGSDSI